MITEIEKSEIERTREIERSIIKRFRKEIWRPFVRALNEYELIAEGDRIAVCISGGKDSMLLAKCMQEILRHGKMKFDLKFLVMDPGYRPENRALIEENARILGIPVHIFETDIFETVADVKDSPCYLCARMRRGNLYANARDLGCNKIALGHHFDDAVQTFFMNLFYGGKLGCFSPKSYLSRRDLWMIRPMVFCEERDIRNTAARLELPIVKSQCPADGCTSRKETELLVAELEKQFPDLRKKVMGAMQRAGLDHWG